MRVEECSPGVEALLFKRWNPGYGQKWFHSPQRPDFVQKRAEFQV